MTAEETKLRMAVFLIQEAKNYLSPMNDKNRVLWEVTCDLENARISIDDQIKKYIKKWVRHKLMLLMMEAQ